MFNYNQNPAHYAIRKVISNDRIEKHMLGSLLVQLSLSLSVSSPLIFPGFSPYQYYFLSEVCVQKVNELSRHQMIWTDEDGFLLKPLGINQ